MAENKPAQINPAQQPEPVDYRAEIIKIAIMYANTDANNHDRKKMIDESAREYIASLKVAPLEKSELWGDYSDMKLRPASELEKRV